MQQNFAAISQKIDLFDRVVSEVDPNSYNIVLNLRFKEEISNRMQIRRWAHLTHINADRLIPLPSHYTQENFLETLRSVNIRYDKIRFARRGSLIDANKETIGTRSNKTYMGPPLLPHIGTAAAAGTTTTPVTVSSAAGATTTPTAAAGFTTTNTVNTPTNNTSKQSYTDVVRGYVTTASTTDTGRAATPINPDIVAVITKQVLALTTNVVTL